MRRLIAILAMLLLTLTFAPTVNAGTQGSCASGDTTKVYAYENAIGDHSDGDDMLYICGNVTNLSSISHTLAGTCKTTFGPGDTWNDCISSVTPFVPTGQMLCMYLNATYGNLTNYFTHASTGIRYNVAADAITSLKWITSGDSCPG